MLFNIIVQMVFKSLQEKNIVILLQKFIIEHSN